MSPSAPSSSSASSTTYDVIVIGGGPAGEACAAHVARAGGSVALIERELVGGECPYWGCMPSKALLRPGELLAETRRVPGVAETAPARVDAAAAFARRDEVVRRLDDTSHAERIERLGVQIIRGHGRLTGERRVQVTSADAGEQTANLIARRAVVLAPGLHATMPPIDGLADAGAWTNREATLAPSAPARLGVIGGGVIGVELACAFATLGSDVTILNGGPRVLGREEPDASRLVAQSLTTLGVTIRNGSRVQRVARQTDGSIHVWSGDSAGEQGADPLVFDELLVAAGRTANTAGLGLETVGVAPSPRDGTVAVTDCMYLADHKWLFVIGDANGRAQFTHAAVYQAKVAARNALGIETHCVEDRVGAPRVVFCEPNVCAVGHTLESAQAAGLRVRAFDRDPQRVAASSFHGRGTEGFARLVLDLDTQRLVGATFVGADLSDLLHSATIAIVGEVPVERLRHCVAPFPTRSEVWTRLVELIDREEQREQSTLPSL